MEGPPAATRRADLPKCAPTLRKRPPLPEAPDWDANASTLPIDRLNCNHLASRNRIPFLGANSLD